ncbi:MAG: zinc ribbon domain-containing protein, partial [Oscillospiraceae bacterium]|nr:zinc ribbon domain-containing protein [Oscillospiraceae bacterium]
HSTGQYVYYRCRTYRDKSKSHCTKHTIRIEVLEKAVLAAIQKQIELTDSLSEMIDEINNAPIVHTESLRLNSILEQRTKEQEKVLGLLDGLYMDWKSGDLTRDQYRRMKIQFEEQATQLEATISHIREECESITRGIDTENPYLTTFLKHRNIQELSRGLLVELVHAIYIHEDGSIDIEFNFPDQYRRIVEFIENNKKELCNTGDKAT